MKLQKMENKIFIIYMVHDSGKVNYYDNSDTIKLKGYIEKRGITEIKFKYFEKIYKMDTNEIRNFIENINNVNEIIDTYNMKNKCDEVI